jgi:hypothetical protein
MLFDIID